MAESLKNRSFIVRLFIFLGINFAALGLGSILQGAGPSGDWYQNLDKALWTPPGWVFGAAWFIIMACFSIYMAVLIKRTGVGMLVLFTLQFILNVSWNPVFFYFHDILIALLIIVGLTLLMLFFLIHYWKKMSYWSVLVLPYCIWLLLAISLNIYAYLNN